MSNRATLGSQGKGTSHRATIAAYTVFRASATLIAAQNVCNASFVKARYAGNRKAAKFLSSFIHA